MTVQQEQPQYAAPLIEAHTIQVYNENDVPHIGGVEHGDIYTATQDLVQACFNHAATHNWWPTGVKDNPLHFSNKLCLIHSEISEAMEGDRKSKIDEHLPQFDSRTVELADAVIRIMDLAGGYQLPLADALLAKLIYNAKRADHKKEVREAAGGKAY